MERDNHFKGMYDEFIDKWCDRKNENNEIEIAFSHYNNIWQCSADFEKRGFREVRRREEHGIYYVTFKQKINEEKKND